MFINELTTYLNGGKKTEKIDGSTSGLRFLGVQTRKVVQKPKSR
jgi:hypothetical protein